MLQESLHRNQQLLQPLLQEKLLQKKLTSSQILQWVTCRLQLCCCCCSR
jgi:hypothetical protein